MIQLIQRWQHGARRAAKIYCAAPCSALPCFAGCSAWVRSHSAVCTDSRIMHTQTQLASTLRAGSGPARRQDSLSDLEADYSILCNSHPVICDEKRACPFTVESKLIMKSSSSSSSSALSQMQPLGLAPHHHSLLLCSSPALVLLVLLLYFFLCHHMW